MKMLCDIIQVNVTAGPLKGRDCSRLFPPRVCRGGSSKDSWSIHASIYHPWGHEPWYVTHTHAQVHTHTDTHSDGISNRQAESSCLWQGTYSTQQMLLWDPHNWDVSLNVAWTSGWGLLIFRCETMRLKSARTTGTLGTSLLLRSLSRSAAMLFFTCCRVVRSVLRELMLTEKGRQKNRLMKEMSYWVFTTLGQRGCTAKDTGLLHCRPVLMLLRCSAY